MSIKIYTPEPKIQYISKISSLARILSVNSNDLLNISNNTQKFYKQGKLISKKNGEKRVTHDAKPNLKNIHEIIKNRLLKTVNYPFYLHGGIADPSIKRSCLSHAKTHINSHIIFQEDIANFFPNTDKNTIKKTWKYLFNFSDEIAEILSNLTTHENMLPQGWKTSGYLANLVFWEKEAQLVSNLEKKNLSYSRFIDDIVVSSPCRINNNNKNFIISSIYNMLYHYGYEPKRSKHKISTRKDPMSITGLNINPKFKSLTISKSERNEARLAVYNLEKNYNRIEKEDYIRLWNSASGIIARISLFHKKEAKTLREKINKVKLL
ncbi:reverse transcriptase family protein [Piscirickettsia salmonis]|uniref:reverse transcriptase family protein n=1 Tax=Piscirickettsia salmonis TaxID=1238 RepID=UPI0007D8583D|nr:Reverse transcriptase (RNA-dependent DNA polymerase) [Piscirickettsiaceae bacterium NZ-RLO1]